MTAIAPPIEELRADAPEAVSRALARALSKNPADRFGSMAEFSAALGPTVDAEASDSPRARRRLQPSLRARAEDTRQTFARWRTPALVTSLLGLVAYVLLFTFTVPAPGLAVAANREEAIFAGKRVLDELGASHHTPYPTGGPRTSHLTVNDTVFRFLQTALDSASDKTFSRYDRFVWRWNLYDNSGAWRIRIGRQGRIVGVHRDTAEKILSNVHLMPDEARLIAERFLQARGWKVGELRLLGGSADVGRRSEHLFNWAPDSVIPWHVDSAFQLVKATVVGDRVTRYSEDLVLPQAFRFPSGIKRGLHMTATLIARIAAALLVLIAVVLALWRAEKDDLQWKAIRRVLFVATLPLLMQLILSDDGSLLAIYPLLGIALLISSVTAESLAHETRPGMIAGINDLARGRVMSPEFATAVLVGYSTALCLLGVRAAVYAGGHLLFRLPIPADVPDAFEAVFPWLFVLQGVSWAAVATFAILLSVALAIHFRAPVPLALVSPALLYAALPLASGPPLYTTVNSVIVLVLAAVVWRAGVIAGLIALYVILAMPEVVGLLRSGNVAFFSAGLVGLVLVAVPGMFGIIAYRRLLQMPVTPHPAWPH